jgi:hypothetical protein
MRILLLCVAAAAISGCTTISTELDPQGAPKYRRASKGTGTNFASSRFEATNAPATKALGEDDIQRLFRPGGNGKPAGTN